MNFYLGEMACISLDLASGVRRSDDRAIKLLGYWMMKNGGCRDSSNILGGTMKKIKERRKMRFSEIRDRYKSDAEFRHQLTTGKRNRKHSIRLLSLWSQLGELSLVKDMVARKVPVNGKMDGVTALVQACHWGQSDVAKFLLDNGASVNVKGRGGLTSLIGAAVHGYREIVKMLLEHGANVNVIDDESWTAVRHAYQSEDMGMTNLLLDNGADVNIPDKQGITPLQVASARGDVEAMKLFMKKGARLDDRNKQGGRALMMAVESAEENAVKLLLDEGVDVNEKVGGGAVIHMALVQLFTLKDSGHREIRMSILKLLLQNGADPYCVVDGLNATALNSAAVMVPPEAMELILDTGINVNEVTAPGSTPLFEACKAGRLDMARFLLERGANIERENHYGETCMFHAVWSGDQDLVRFLIEKGAKVNVMDKTGATPLEIAVRSDQEEMVTTLVEAGADVNAEVDETSNVLELAVRQGSEEIVKILSSHGAQYPQELDESEEWTLFVKKEISTAARSGNLDQAMELLDELTDEQARNSNASIVLDCAVERKDVNAARHIIAHFPQIDAQDALAIAVHNRDMDMVKLIVDSNLWDGKKVKDSFSCVSAFKAVARTGKVDMFNFLQKHSRDLQTNPDLGHTLLEISGLRGHLKLVKKLLNLGYGRESGKLNGSGMRVLRSAVEEDNGQFINWLLSEGNVGEEELGNLKDSFLVIVATRNNIALAKKLIDSGADINARGRNGVTPLIKASNLGHTEMVKLFLIRGADLTPRDGKGKSALDHAMARNRIKIIELLKASGAKEE
jgi:ankyrin repeat protein